MKRAGRVLCALLITGSLLAVLAACGGSADSGGAPADQDALLDSTGGQSAQKESGGQVTQKESGGQVTQNGSGGQAAQEESGVQSARKDSGDPVELQVFIAASLNAVMEDLAAMYNETHPDVKILFNADSSGTLMTQIEEGYACDVFFSAAQKQMDQLAGEGYVVDGTRADVVNNQLVVLTQKDSKTKVTGLEDLDRAESIALADGSVPVGRYTRQALMNLGILDTVEDPSLITTQEVSDALGGVEISEQGNVSKVLFAVAEGSCEVGTTYYSDTFGYEDRVKILQTVSSELSGNIIYPIAGIRNSEADSTRQAAAKEFIDFVTSDEAKAVFEKYYFDTDVESAK